MAAAMLAPFALALSIGPTRTAPMRMQVTTPAANSLDAIVSDPMFLDEAALLDQAAFPISEATLIEKAKTFLFYGQGVEKPELLAESFCFMGPFVGGAAGLPKAEYLKAVGGFDIKKAFPDLNPRFHHFRADPLDPGRVWFTSQASGTDNGVGFLGNKPTGKSFSTPPQACSIKFDESGRAIKYTIGHVMERSVGNTGGLGGIFGPAYAIGKPLPFPEANPWKPSKRYKMLMLVGKLLTWLNNRKAADASGSMSQTQALEFMQSAALEATPIADKIAFLESKGVSNNIIEGAVCVSPLDRFGPVQGHP